MQRHLTNIRWGTNWNVLYKCIGGGKSFTLSWMHLTTRVHNEEESWKCVGKGFIQAPRALDLKLHVFQRNYTDIMCTLKLEPKVQICERIYIGEQACIGNECCIVFFIRYSHFGHNEVIYADQKLNKYTECENTSKKTSMSSRFTKKFILGRILIDIMNLLSF